MELAPSGLMIIKKDALTDGIGDAIEEFLELEHGLIVRDSAPVDLSVPELFAIYRPDLPKPVEDTPADVKRMLVTVGAVSMQGVNRILEVSVPGADSQDAAQERLRQVRGGTNDKSTDNTIRGTFPFRRCEGYDQFTFWERAAYFVKNRAHVPDTAESIGVVAALLRNNRTL